MKKIFFDHFIAINHKLIYLKPQLCEKPSVLASFIPEMLTCALFG